MPDIDWGQVIFLLLVVIVGFVRWIGNLIQQQKEAKERAKLSPDELARREAAWRKQVGQEEIEVEESHDPFSELKDLFEQLREPAPPPVAPPPLPARPAPPVFQRTPTPTPVPSRVFPSAPPAPAVPATARGSFPVAGAANRRFTEAVAHRDRPVPIGLKNLRRELSTPRALRQAIIIREILGPPKALAES